MSSKKIHIKDSDEWSGWIDINFGTRKERKKLARDYHSKTADIDKDDTEAYMNLSDELEDMFVERVEKLELKHLPTKTTVKDVEELLDSKEGAEFVSGHIAPMLISGPPVGNVLKLPSLEQQSS